MGKVDRLSKKPNWKVRVDRNQKLIRKEWIHSLTEVVVENSKVNILKIS